MRGDKRTRWIAVLAGLGLLGLAGCSAGSTTAASGPRTRPSTTVPTAVVACHYLTAADAQAVIGAVHPVQNPAGKCTYSGASGTLAMTVSPAAHQVTNPLGKKITVDGRSARYWAGVTGGGFTAASIPGNPTTSVVTGTAPNRSVDIWSQQQGHVFALTVTAPGADEQLAERALSRVFQHLS